MEYSINMTEVFRPGDKIQSRYRILNQLGTGGFSRTYLAEDTNRFNERCVLKVFTPRLSEHFTLAKAREMFEREAEVLHRLEHPQIPKFHQILHHGNDDSGCLLLVQDYIKGESYHQLLNQRGRKGQKFNEQEIELLLLKVLPVLEYIHSYGIIHRDISPENLILDLQRQLPILIDFGCIKEIEEKAQLQLVEADSANLYPIVGTAIGKAHYAPPEQIIQGKVSPNTDLYALASTAVVLLTGKKPQELRNGVNLQWNWQSFASVNPQLEKILSKMLESDPDKRFSSAKEVITVLQDSLALSITPTQKNNSGSLVVKPNKLNYKFFESLLNIKYVKIILPIFLLFLFGKLISSPIFTPQPASETFNTRDVNSKQLAKSLKGKLSLGERLLVSNLVTPEKEKAVKAYAKRNYQEAAYLLSDSLRRQPNDPEALIYLNNAIIGEQKSHSIAVSVPLSNNSNSALEVMRGVAQAQDQINQQGGIQGIPLKVQIVNDENNPDLAQKIAFTLTQNKQILGVVGHYSSEVTLATADIYQTGKLVAISPISSSVKLANINPYLFRTVSSDFIAARALAQYAVEEKNQKNLAIFYSSQSDHSESLKLEFKSAVTLLGGKVVNIFDLSDPNFSAVDSVQQAIDSGAEALMLSTNPRKLDKALQVIRVNRQFLGLYGGDDVYTSKTLQVGGEDARGMVLEIPWHLKSNLESDFVRTSQKLWNADVSWRTAMGYDAAQALITAIDVNSSQVSRTNIQKALVDPNFVALGADEEVRFLPSGNRVNSIQLVEIQPTSDNSNYEYVPIEP